MDIYSTANVPRSTCANYWNEVYSSKFARVTFNPMDREGFAAELKVGSVGELSESHARFAALSEQFQRGFHEPCSRSQSGLTALIRLHGFHATIQSDD